MRRRGGNNQWTYPWGNTPNTDPLPAHYYITDGSPFLVMGSFPAGNGRWGQADLAGSMWEWVFDWYASPYSPANCSNCADSSASSARVVRGGGWLTDGGHAGDGADALTATYRSDCYPANRFNGLIAVGARCARAAQ